MHIENGKDGSIEKKLHNTFTHGNAILFVHECQQASKKPYMYNSIQLINASS